MNKQEIFDKVFLGLKSQDFVQSADKYGSCVYRHPNGLKCAIGHLIPDEAYTKSLDEIELYADKLPVRIYEAIGVSAEGEDPKFLRLLQNVHDDNTNPIYMRDALKLFAKNHKLTIPE